MLVMNEPEIINTGNVVMTAMMDRMIMMQVVAIIW